MTHKKLTVYACTCDRPGCQHKWITRTAKLPKVCPKCKQLFAQDKPRRTPKTTTRTKGKEK